MNGLEYLEKFDMESSLDSMIAKQFKLIQEHDGEMCVKCKVVQGHPLKGFHKYYCKCLRNKIERRLEKEKEKNGKKIMDFVLLRLSERDLTEV